MHDLICVLRKLIQIADVIDELLWRDEDLRRVDIILATDNVPLLLLDLVLDPLVLIICIVVIVLFSHAAFEDRFEELSWLSMTGRVGLWQWDDFYYF